MLKKIEWYLSKNAYYPQRIKAKFLSQNNVRHPDERCEAGTLDKRKALSVLIH